MHHKTYVLKRDVKITKHVTLKKGQEVEVVNQVVYMGGFPVSFELQKIMLQWIKDNPDSLIDDTRHF